MAMIKLTQDFKEFLQLLDSEKIEYLLIGAYAVGLHGYVRGTNDMDVWVATDPTNVDRLIAALIKFGFAPQSISREIFAGEQTIFRMGFPPNRLEIFTQIPGVNFTECYARRLTLDYEGMQVSVIAYEDLKANKQASGRNKDKADIEMLEKRREQSKPGDK
jgi:phage replication-related protein YjqB (UPF0714/DUF867 family)